METQLKFNELNQTIIPEGYKWCHNCEALTPHKKDKEYTDQSRCYICNNYKTGIIECPNCGADEDENYCEKSTVIIHQDGCHFGKETHQFKYDSYADQILKDFTKDYLKLYPNRGSFELPRDNEWYYQNQKLKKKLKEHKEKWQCGCPRYNIYRNINQIVLEGHYYASMDCSNAYWWKYKVRCNKCGYVYENDADSC